MTNIFETYQHDKERERHGLCFAYLKEATYPGGPVAESVVEVEQTEYMPASRFHAQT